VPHADYRLNTSNNATARSLEELGFVDAILSPELTLPRIRDIAGARYAVVYGKVPLMTLEKCVMREISDCDKCKKNGWGYLSDRKGVRFAVRREWNHRNIVFNSVPFYMADKKDMLTKYRIGGEHFIFTDESADEADKIIDAYKKGLAPSAKQVRRINV
jgi:putative protease